MSTFLEFKETKQARDDIAAAVLRHTKSLCEALRQNYVDYAIRGHKQSRDRIDCTASGVEYHNRCINDLSNGILPIDYVIESGRKYHKIIFVDGGASRSVHCFVDKKTGEVYKSASWKSPAKGVRYDLRIIEQREWLFEHADWSGGYLYAK